MDTSRRLLAIEEGLEEWISRHQVEVIAIERVFAQHNLMTVVGTAQAAGIAMLVAARHGLEVHQHTPSEVKASITGSGRADKAQVGLMVSRILHLDSPPKPADAADAVALAICHSWRGAAVKRLAQVVPSTKRPRSWAQVTSVRKVMA
jgi:crossover junction endodeoxyribonuclease RuvC